MKVLGVDAALRRTGLALVRDDELVYYDSFSSGKERTPTPLRLRAICLMVRRVIEELRPDLTVIEKPGRWARGKGNTSIETIEALAKARAAVEIAAAPLTALVEIPVNKARDLIIGRPVRPGDGSIKDIVRRGVELRTGIYVKDADAADAAVVALAGYSLAVAGDRDFQPPKK
jgi:Holliday junction resolvasome RuvABC endonuclease subunit